MSENPSEHNNDEERLPKTSAQSDGGNRIPPTLVAGPESENDDNFRKAYLEYVAACEEINRRLMEVAPLLERGLYSEAIDLAEIEPKLVDWVNIHDLPKLGRLSARLKRLDLSPPPELNLNIVSQLNKAYRAR